MIIISIIKTIIIQLFGGIKRSFAALSSEAHVNDPRADGPWFRFNEQESDLRMYLGQMDAAIPTGHYADSKMNEFV